jgi:hypothetical protein
VFPPALPKVRVPVIVPSRASAIATTEVRMVEQQKPNKKKRTAATPTALPVVRPQVAGIDIGSAEHA